MAHDVFISYSSLDKAVADAVCAKLESQKVRCWIAPRDVPAGQSWAGAIVNAIRTSRVFVLVLSSGSNKSTQVVREVEQAVENAIPILPFRIENIEPSDEMRYFIKSIHWLDAMNPPIERHLEKLANSVQALLAVGEESAQTAAAAPSIPPAQKRRALPVWAILLLTVIVIAAIGGVAAWMLKQQEQAPLALATQGSPEITAEATLLVLTPSPVDTEWRPLGFVIPNETLWSQDEESYTVAKVPNTVGESIAWSEEIIEGDFVFSADVTSKYPDSGQAGFIVYGDGHGFSDGCLIFTFGSGFALITRDTLYHEGENFLVVNEGDFNFQEPTHNMTIEIRGDLVNFYVDAKKVASTFLPIDFEPARQDRNVPALGRTGGYDIFQSQNYDSVNY